MAHGEGTISRRLAQLARIDVLLLDDSAGAPIDSDERSDLLELLEARANQGHDHYQPTRGGSVARVA